MGQWQGFKVALAGRLAPSQNQQRETILIELVRDPEVPLLCSGCGQEVQKVHDVSERWILDLPAWGADTEL
jgi:hypothetical protein